MEERTEQKVESAPPVTTIPTSITQIDSIGKKISKVILGCLLSFPIFPVVLYFATDLPRMLLPSHPIGFSFPWSELTYVITNALIIGIILFFLIKDSKQGKITYAILGGFLSILPILIVFIFLLIIGLSAL